MKNSIVGLSDKEMKNISGGNSGSMAIGGIISGAIYIGVIIISKWLVKKKI